MSQLHSAAVARRQAVEAGHEQPLQAAGHGNGGDQWGSLPDPVLVPGQGAALDQRADQLFDGIAAIVDDRALAEAMRDANVAKAAGFSTDRMADAYEKDYRNILG